MTEANVGAEDRRALYLRWRPRTFADVVGQEPVTRTLRNAVARDSVAHGYLFCGPRGTGKTSLARILYRALNCANATDGDPCGKCASCQAADDGRAMDLIEIDAASNRGIDDIRDLRERVRFAPAEAKWKLYIVDEAHQLTAAAWDAFLKTLEEPPPHTVFVLATTSAHKVPATIVSRCQRFDLTRIPQPKIAEHLNRVAQQEGIELQAGVADRLARLAHGGLRDALGMLEQVASFAGSPVTIEAARRVLGLARGDALRAFIDAVSSHDAAAAFAVLEDLVQEGADLRQFLGEVLFDLRGALLARVGAETAIAADFGQDQWEWLGSVGQRWAPASLAAALREFADLEVPGLDERQLLIRFELAVATITGFAEADPLMARAGMPAAEFRVTDDMHEVEERMNVRETLAPYEPPIAPSSATAEPEPAVSPGSSAPAPSLAVVQGQWQAVLDGYVGNLLDKIMLARVRPTALQEGLLTLGGRLDALELRKIESCRKALETRLANVFSYPLRVRFAADDSQPPEHAEPPAGAAPAAAVASVSSASPLAELVPPASSSASPEPEWADDVPMSDESSPDGEETGLSLAETAARLFGGEIVADAAESGR